MNRIFLKGNLTRDPEVREVIVGGRPTTVANFTLAVSRFFKRANGERDKETTFVPCEAWDTGAESMSKILHKGDPVLLEGSLKNDAWEKDGQKFSRHKVRVSSFDKLYRAPKVEITAEDYEETSDETVFESEDEKTEETETVKETVGAGKDIPF